MHPSGRLLFAGNAEGVWIVGIDGSCAIEATSGQVERMDGVTALAASADGTHLVAGARDGSLARFDIDRARGRILSSRELASVVRPTAIALKHD
jgi:hypothetical protein